MANVTVYNMEGKEVGTMEPVMQDRVQQELRSGQVAEWYSHRFRETILSK